MALSLQRLYCEREFEVALTIHVFSGVRASFLLGILKHKTFIDAYRENNGILGSREGRFIRIAPFCFRFSTPLQGIEDLNFIPVGCDKLEISKAGNVDAQYTA
jgi:hypothetical protein